MDIGSGLVIQTRTVNGKPSAGIFLNSGNVGNNYRDKTKTKYGRYPIRNRTTATENTKNLSKRITNTATEKKTDSNSQEIKPKNQRVQSGKKASATTSENQKEKPTTTTDRLPLKKTTDRVKVQPTNRKLKPGSKGQEFNKDQEVNTKFVTLTQGQLNTILSLVKSKNEIDISNVLENKDEQKKENAENLKDEDENDMNSAGKDENNSSRPTSGKYSKDDITKADENVTNLLKNGEKPDASEKGKSELEKKKKSTEQKTTEKGKKNTGENLNKPKNDAKSRENSNLTNESYETDKPDSNSSLRSQECLPAAMRSSFFFGEAGPREHAFSAKKREEQQRWREELDKQRIEQQEKKVSERNARFRAEENESWSKHFDTMLPTKVSPRQNEVRSSLNVADSVTDISLNTQTVNLPKNVNTAPVPSFGNIAALSAPSEGSVSNSIEVSENREFGSTMPTNLGTNSAPQRSSYLRTMTSLLDPAQIEALELKRQKQEEHRRAIEAQVEERKRKKEEEENLRRQHEIEEDRRLAAEHDMLAQQTELEKRRQQLQENMREQKTKELYQQMKDAQESALRDKLSRREQILRNKGHDTSRLEQTHQLTLETTRKFIERPLAQTSQVTLASSSLTNLHLPTEVISMETVTPRQAVAIGDGHAPMAMTAQTDKGPIQFEISLNQIKQGEMVESAVQTDDRISDARRGNERNVRYQNERTSDARRLRLNDGYDSDDMTEYMQLPQRNNTKKKERDRRGKSQKLQNYERDLERQYDQHSRNAIQPRPKKNEKRPKWGVGDKNKNFVPASQRYTTGQQIKEAVMRREREERAEVNEPERSQMMSQSPMRNHVPDHQRPRSPVVPAARHQQKSQARQTNRGLVRNRPSSGIHATTEQAKYRQEKHSRDSPVPETSDFVQYRRTTDVLDPSKVESRPETGPMKSRTEFVQRPDRPLPAVGSGVEGGDPLLNPDIIRQHERQDQILKEISILRQGLLIKQREVASYPAAITHSMSVPSGIAPTNLVLAAGGNLPERTNDTR
ncbi:coiled-coil domain-containing protein 66-like [Styela clava]